MSKYKATFSLGVQPTGFLALTGSDGTIKKRVQSPDDAAEFVTGTEAVLQASTELNDGEKVKWVQN